MHHRTLILVAGLLAGCKGDAINDEPRIFCNGFGSAPTTSWACNNCNAVNPNAAYDRDTDTATSIVPGTNATSESATLQVTTSGANFASGTTVGVFVKQPSLSGFNTSNVIETYVDGKTTPEETSVNNTNTVAYGSAGWGGPTGYLGFRTTKAYDSVKFSTTNTWPSGQAPVYEVYEICSDGGPL